MFSGGIHRNIYEVCLTCRILEILEVKETERNRLISNTLNSQFISNSQIHSKLTCEWRRDLPFLLTVSAFHTFIAFIVDIDL